MSFVFNEEEFKKESEEFYSTYPVDVSEIENELNQRYEKEKDITVPPYSSIFHPFLSVIFLQPGISGKLYRK